MSDALAGLEPRELWSHFAALSAIPRPSKSEARAAAWVRGVADARGLRSRSDRAGNVIVDVPAVAGRESAPIVALQAHLDMVCEKDQGSTHDFDHDPIRPRLDGDWIRADGTTLGADNGVGVAAALALATASRAAHGPLQLVFTVDEETGLTGAAQLDAGLVQGDVLLNLDSEDDGVLFVGCAGGADTILDVRVGWTAPTPATRAHRITLGGLRGGHSGGDIHQHRGNALKLLDRLLVAALDGGIPLELFELAGGGKPNAIAREASAGCYLAEEGVERMRALIARVLREFREELGDADDKLQIAFTPCQHPGRALERADRNRLLHLLAALPHGVLEMSRHFPGVVETSTNLAALEERDGELRIVCSSRSSVDSKLDSVLASIRSIGTLAGADVGQRDRYPGWKPDLSSPVLGVARQVFGRLWGREPEVTAIHAGLECGVLRRKLPDVDMISFGPQIVGAHSPAEAVNVPSVQRFYGALEALLEALASGSGQAIQ